MLPCLCLPLDVLPPLFCASQSSTHTAESLGANQLLEKQACSNNRTIIGHLSPAIKAQTGKFAFFSVDLQI